MLLHRSLGTRGASQAAGGAAILVALLDVDAGSVREPRLCARDQVALAATKQQSVIRPLVFQRIVAVRTSLVGIEEGSAEFATRCEASVRLCPVGPAATRQAI